MLISRLSSAIINRIFLLSLILLVIFTSKPALAVDQANENSDYLSPESLNISISQLIMEKLTLPDDAQIEIKLDTKNNLNQILQKSELVEELILNDIDANYQRFNVRVNFADQTYDNLTGKYYSYIDMPILSRHIKFNEIINSNDLKLVKIRSDKISNNFLTLESEIAGNKAKRALNAGSFIKRTDIAAIPVIKNNDPVNITFKNENISLKTVGTALGSGGIGENIKVRNDNSGIVLFGEILDKNTVMVSK